MVGSVPRVAMLSLTARVKVKGGEEVLVSVSIESGEIFCQSSILYFLDHAATHLLR